MISICTAMTLVLGIGLSVVFLARPVQVNGLSMLPTLKEGDVLLMDCVRTVPSHGDVIVSHLRGEDGLWLVKRVVGLPGDEIFIDKASGQVYRNGEMLKETYVQELSYEPCDTGFPVTVPEGHIFVLGDNREVSVDSRSAQIGMVPLDTLIGRVWSSSRLVD